MASGLTKQTKTTDEKLNKLIPNGELYYNILK